MKKKRKLRLWVKLTLPVVLGFCIAPFVLPKTEEVQGKEELFLPTVHSESSETLRKQLAECIAINPDVQALLVVGNLIREPVLQGPDNSTYLDLDWKTGEQRSYGSVFLDYRCDKEAQNRILYGHYVYEKANKDRTLMFTPLARLKERNVFEACKTIDYVTTSGIDRYRLLGTMDVHLECCGDDYLPPSELAYNVPEYSALDMEVYRKNAENNWTLRSDVSWTGRERLLTLQTCIEGEPEMRQIVLAVFERHLDFGDC